MGQDTATAQPANSPHGLEKSLPLRTQSLIYSLEAFFPVLLASGHRVRVCTGVHVLKPKKKKKRKVDLVHVMQLTFGRKDQKLFTGHLLRMIFLLVA